MLEKAYILKRSFIYIYIIPLELRIRSWCPHVLHVNHVGPLISLPLFLCKMNASLWQERWELTEMWTSWLNLILTPREFRREWWRQSLWWSKCWGASVPIEAPLGCFHSQPVCPLWLHLKLHFWEDWNLLNWVQGCGQLNKKCFIYFLTGF